MVGALAPAYLVALSLSKAAILSYFLLLAIHFSRSLWLLILAAVAIAILYFAIGDADIVGDVVNRLQNIGKQRDDSLEGRGYTRIWVYPQHLLLGAGEFGWGRFKDVTSELHSTLGTILFSYGSIGLVLFSLILWRLFRFVGLAHQPTDRSRHFFLFSPDI